MEVLATTQMLKHGVNIDIHISFGAECPCDHEGCNQTECSLKT